MAWCQTIVSEENDTVERLSDGAGPCKGQGTKSDPWRCTELVWGGVKNEILKQLRKHISENTRWKYKDRQLACVTLDRDNTYSSIFLEANQWTIWVEYGFTWNKYYWELMRTEGLPIYFKEGWWFWLSTYYTYHILEEATKKGQMVWLLPEGKYLCCWNKNIKNEDMDDLYVIFKYQLQEK